MTPDQLEYVGVSKLRALNARSLCALQKILIILAHNQPLAALIPYGEYMKAQELILLAERLTRVQP